MTSSVYDKKKLYDTVWGSWISPFSKLAERLAERAERQADCGFGQHVRTIGDQPGFTAAPWLV